MHNINAAGHDVATNLRGKIICQIVSSADMGGQTMSDLTHL